MNFGEMLENGAKKVGTTRALSKIIGVSESNISSAKTHCRGIPNKACLKLAEILEIDALKVIAAKEEWMAKTQEDKEFWHPLANAAGLAAICLTFATTVFSPSPALAASTMNQTSPTLCIMSNVRRRIMTLAWAIWSIACGNWLASFGSYYFADRTTPA